MQNKSCTLTWIIAFAIAWFIWGKSNKYESRTAEDWFNSYAVQEERANRWEDDYYELKDMYDDLKDCVETEVIYSTDYQVTIENIEHDCL